MRPRYNGYLHFQDHAGDPLQDCLEYDGDPSKALREMNKLYEQSLSKQTAVTA
jgi:multiple sugar transport system substrate-binding protein